MNKQILLGSGKLYIIDYEFGDTIPEHSVFETPENSVGSIKGGASLIHSYDLYSFYSDGLEEGDRYITNEEVIFKTGILSWDMKNLERLSGSGTIQETEDKIVLRLGEEGTLKKYALRFVHTQSNGKKVRITLLATASKGFELIFDPEVETVIDAEFKALRALGEKTLLIVEQEK